MIKSENCLNLLILGTALVGVNSFANTSEKSVSPYDQAFTADDKKLTFKMSTLKQDSDLYSANVFATSVNLAFSKQLDKNLSFNFNGGLYAESGSSDSLLDNSPYVPDNGISLKKAELNYNLNKNISLMAGSISLKEFNNQLMLRNTSFLGMAEKLNLIDGGLSLNLRALQSTPHNRNYSNRLDKVDEGNPNFFLENLNLKYESGRNNIDLNLSHYAYDNLSNSVAAKSMYMGNTVNLNSSNSGEFVYSYIGWSYGVSATANIYGLDLIPFYQKVINTSAPENNEARIAGLRSEYTFDGLKFSAHMESFETQADAYVSFYASHTHKANTAGQGLSLEVLSLRNGLELDIEYFQTREIENNQLDRRDEEEIVYVGVKREYEL